MQRGFFGDSDGEGGGAAPGDSFLNVGEGDVVEVKVKGSRFMGVAFPASGVS